MEQNWSLIQRMMLQNSQDSLYLNHWKRPAKLSPFLIEKITSSKVILWSVKKTRNSNFLKEMDHQKHAENIFKMKTFLSRKYKAYPHERLNTSKGVIRSWELSLAVSEKIREALKKQNVTDYKRITLRRCKEVKQTNLYILAFKKTQDTLGNKNWTLP